MIRLGFLVWVSSFVVTLYALVGVFQHDIHVDTNFINFFIESKTQSGQSKARGLYEDRMLRNAVVLLSSSNKPKLIEKTTELANKLCASDYILKCTWQVGDGEMAKLYTFYAPFKQYLFTQDKLQELKNSPLEKVVNKRLQELYSPLAMAESSQLATDPFGLMNEYLRGLSFNFNFRPDDGLLLYKGKDEYHSLMTLKIDTSKSDIGSSHGIDFSEIAQAFEGDTEIEVNVTSGLLYMADGAKRSMDEASTFGILSVFLVFLVILLVWKSLMPLLAVFLTILFSSAVGFLVCYKVYSQIHVATLLLGVSLLGVVADYSIHFFSHHMDDASVHQKSTMSRILKPFLLSLLTSIIGYASFYLTGMMVLQQLSVFSVFGLLAAAFTVLTLYPQIPVISKPAKSGLSQAIISFSAFKTMIVSMSPVVKYLSIFVLLLGGFSLKNIVFDDDVRKLQSPSAGLVKQEQKISELTGVKRQPGYYLIEGISKQQMLEKEEELAVLHHDKAPSDVLSHLSAWIPSQKLQNQSLSQYVTMRKAVSLLYKKLGVLEPSYKSSLVYRKTSVPMLTVDTWLQANANLPIAEQYLGQIEGHFYSVVQVISGEFLPEEVLPEGVSVVNRATEVSAMFKNLRVYMISIIIGLLFMVFLIVGLVFDFKSSAKICISPAQGMVWSALICFWLSGYLDLFHILGLLLVFFLSIDYSFFNFFSRNNQDDFTNIGIGVSVLTTLFSFGVLVFSQTAAIQHFGQSVLIGIVVSYLFTVRQRISI